MRRPFRFLPVVVVLAILALLVVPRINNTPSLSKSRIAKIQISEFEQALKALASDTGRFPTSAEGLEVLVNDPGNLKDWKGPYLKKNMPNDPWGRTYVYRFPGIRNPDYYDLWSNGPDGIEGTEDDVANYK
jgi:general secretion pathway protein G